MSNAAFYLFIYLYISMLVYVHFGSRNRRNIALSAGLCEETWGSNLE